MTSDAPPGSFRMRIDLDPTALYEQRWPPGIRVRCFTPRDAEGLHALLVRGYRHGGGSVAELDTWLPQMTGDEEYDPALWFLADAKGELAGAILCWKSGFVKDLMVDEPWRGRGLGEALLRRALSTFASRGMDTVELKVHADNAAAIRLYERVGMRVVERLARD
jgi:ribosomal protein S18 acetylase RimI-like enzyme